MSAEIAVLLPCYNESMTVEKVVADFRAVLPDAKIYVYDNNSSDNTAELAKKSRSDCSPRIPARKRKCYSHNV